jgi:GT2 family glycosyltransferase
MKRVAIILLNYNGMERKFNGKGILQESLKRLLQTNYNNLKIIVVDNGSTDDSLRVIKSAKCDLLRLENNVYNFSYVNNKGIFYAIHRYNPDYVVLFSNDVFAENKNWLRELVVTAESHKHCGILTCKLRYPTGRIQQAGGIIGIAPRSRGRGEIDKGQYNKIEEVEASTAAMCLLKKELINKIGLFDENLKFGFEDTDYCVRARKSGFSVMYDGRVSLTHLEGYTHVNSPKKSARDRFFENNQKNWVYFIFKNFGFVKRFEALLIILFSAIFSIESSTRQRKLSSLRLKDRILWRVSVTFRAIFEGYNIYRKKGSEMTLHSLN